jgi:Ni/Fe-hydrogenase subunit HybB-like protein
MSTAAAEVVPRPAAIVRGPQDDEALTYVLLRPLDRPGRGWWLLMLGSGTATIAYITAMAWSFATGVGLWGNDIPTAWGFPIVNFVWWIGIGHAGTFLSAMLLLTAQPWRSSVSRLAEAVALFALLNAGIMPILHLGRAWFGYWLIPHPSSLDVWPQFKSTLTWDVVSITAHITVSLLFFYMGMIPDLATVRDRAKGAIRRRVYGLLALGWNGSARQWRQHRTTYLMLAGIATALVISGHTIVSMDFAITLVPGWHTTIAPFHFIAVALLSGMAAVLVAMLPVRHVYRLHDVITERHLDSIARLMLAFAWMVIYSYVLQIFIAWYGANPYERDMWLQHRTSGDFATLFWGVTLVNAGLTQLLWSRRLRVNTLVLFSVATLVTVATWADRLILVTGSLQRDFLPSAWGRYVPTWVDWVTLLGSIGMVVFLLTLFVHWLPPIPIAETKAAARQRRQEATRSP